MIIDKYFGNTKTQISELDKNTQQIKFGTITDDIMSDVVKLLKVAYDIKCDFECVFNLSVGEFAICSESFNDIKIINKTKNAGTRVVVKYSNALLSNETIIPLENILCIKCKIVYYNDGVDDNNVDEEKKDDN